MGMFGTKTRAKSSRVEQEAMLSADRVRRGAEAARSEIDRADSEKKPGVFARFVGWVKGLFSKNKNEPNLFEGATQEGNVGASGISADIGDTLSPEVTGEGVSSAPETGIPVTSVFAESIGNSTADRQSDAELAAIVEANGEKGVDGAFSDEGAEPDENAAPENESKTEPEELEDPQKKSESKNGITFDTRTEDGNLFSESGTIRILGKDVAWTASDRIYLTTDENGAYYGSGTVTFKDERLTCDTAVVAVSAGRAKYYFDGGLGYVRDGIKIALDTEQNDLEAFKPDKVTLLNYTREGDAPMMGDVTITAEGFQGSAERELGWVPGRLSADGDVRLVLSADGGKLGFSLSSENAAAFIGSEKTALLKSGTVTVDVLENGDITYHLPADYTLDIMDGMFVKPVTLAALDITYGAGVSSLEVPDLDLEYDGAAVLGASLGLSLGDGNKGAAFSAEKITYKSLSLNKLSGAVGEEGISAAAESFTFSVGETAVTGSVDGFSWKPGAFFSVNKLAVAADVINFDENISVSGANVELSLVEKEFSMTAGAALDMDNARLGLIAINADNVRLTLRLVSAGEGFGFSADIEGTVTFTVGAGDDPAASAEISDITYADGAFSLGSVSLSAELSKLISEKFSGNAAITAEDLKFSKNAAKPIDFKSLTLSGNIGYNGRELARNVSASLVLREGETEAPSEVSGGELAIGESAGVLENAALTVYMTENKRGVRLTAGEFRPSFGEYVSLDIKDLDAEFISGAESRISADSAKARTQSKLNELIGSGELSLGVEGLSVTADRIWVSRVFGDVGAADIANSISFTDLHFEAGFAEDKTLSALLISGSANVGDIALVGAEISSAGGEELRISADSIDYAAKKLSVTEAAGTFSKSGVKDVGARFSLTVLDTDITGSVAGLGWSDGGDFSVETFTVAADNIRITDKIALQNAGLSLSLKDKVFAFSANALMTLDTMEYGVVRVNAAELGVSLDLGNAVNEGGRSELDFGGEVTGKVGVDILSGGAVAASASAENIKFGSGLFSVETLSAEAKLENLLSGGFTGNAGLNAKGLKFAREEASSVVLDSLLLDISELGYNGRTLLSSANAAIVFKDGMEEAPAAAKGGELSVGDSSGALNDVSVTFYMTETRRGVRLSAGGFSPKFGEYVLLNVKDLKARLIDGNNEFSAASAEAESLDKLNKLIGCEKITLGAEGFAMSSEGISVDRLKANVSGASIANAVTFSVLDIEAGFGSDKQLNSLRIGGSAKLGNIAELEDVSITSDGGEEMDFSAKSVNYRGGKLVITDASGVFGKSGVKNVNGAFTAAVLGKEAGGSVKNLSWSGEGDFSVEELLVSAAEFNINDDISVKNSQLKLSLVNNKFGVSAAAAFHVNKTQKGIVEIAESELSVELSLGNEEEGFNFTGKVEGAVGVKIGDFAEARAGNISYEGGKFTFGEFSVGAELNKLYEKLGGKGNITVNDLVYEKGMPLSVGAMKLSAAGVTLNGKPLMSELSVNIILSDDQKPEGENAAVVETASPALKDGTEGTLEGLNVSVYLTDTYRGVKLSADRFNAKLGSFEFSFSGFSAEFSAGKNELSMGEATARADFSEPFSKISGIQSLDITAQNAEFKTGKFSVGKVTAAAAADIDILGFTIKGASAEFSFGEDMAVKSIKFGGELGYKDYISGRGSIIYDDAEGMSFDNVSGLKMSYGCFSGSVGDITKTGDSITFTTLKLAKTSRNGEDDFGGGEKSLAAKFLKTVPDIGITVKELKIENGKLVKPSYEDVSIDKFEKNVDLGEKLRASVKYTGGEAGQFAVTLHSGVNIPSEGDAPKNIDVLYLPIPIAPPVLTASFSLGFSVKLNAGVDVSAAAARTAESLDIDAAVKSRARINAGFYGAVMLHAGIGAVGIKGGLKLGADLDTNAALDGTAGISYDPEAETFFKAFSISREKTALNFELKSDLVFNVSLEGGLTGLPAILSEGKLSHSWNLFSYKIGSARITGGVAYSPKDGKYMFSADPVFTRGGGFPNYDPERTEEEFSSNDKTIEGLRDSMARITEILGRAKAGADPSKGGTDGVSSGLGAAIEDDKEILAAELKKRIDEVFLKSRENAVKCHRTMNDLRKIVEKSAEELIETEHNVKMLETVIEDSRTALGIIGYGEDKGEMTREKYERFIGEMRELLEDNEKLDELAKLDPSAVVNMFKAFKLNGTADWDDIHKFSSGLTSWREVGEVPEYQSKINAGIYGDAMNSLSQILKNKEREIAQREKAAQAAEEELARAQERKKTLSEERRPVLQRIEDELKALDAEEERVASDRAAYFAGLDAMRIEDYCKDRKTFRGFTLLSDSQRKTHWKAVDAYSAAVKKHGVNSEQAREKLAEYQKNYRLLEDIAESNRSASKAKREESDADRVEDIGKRRAAKNEELKRGNQGIVELCKKLDDEVAACVERRQAALESYFRVKYEMSSTADISTAMLGFDEFVKQEHDQTANLVAERRKKYSDIGENAQISDYERGLRKTNVKEIIKTIIGSATEDALAKNFSTDRRQERASERFVSRVNVIREGSGFADVSMRSYGISGSNGEAAFGRMKEDSQKFQTLLDQLDRAYQQLNDFHNVMTDVLKSWNEVNGIDYRKIFTAAEFAENTKKAAELVSAADKIRDKAIDENYAQRLTEEADRIIGGAERTA